MTTNILTALQRTRAASRALAKTTDDTVRKVLIDLAKLSETHEAEILAANGRDLARMNPQDPKYDRLLLNPARMQAIRDDLKQVASLPTPLGQVLEHKILDNGLDLSKVRVPLGVVAVVFESRPNVTFDVFALCLKSGNGCVLKGSRDACDSNRAIAALMGQALNQNGLPAATVYLAPAERAALAEILDAVGLIDIAIPRGSQGLIDYVREHSKIPVIETGAGIVHTYVDASADLEVAERIVFNAKTRRVSVCNALDTLLLHRDLLPHLPALVARMGTQHQVAIHADPTAYQVLVDRYPGPLQPADDGDFGHEFLDYEMAIKVVDDLAQALTHIERYSSRHSEAIVAQDKPTVEVFLAQVDAAAVYANASTAFTDGGQFGMGAEIGISTQMLHARGPMALPELTSYKWVVRGTGQIRA